MKSTRLHRDTVRRRRNTQRSLARTEKLEIRRFLSVTSVFELDGNAVTTTTHDWDQIYADNQAVPPTKTSGALASTFLKDAVNTTADDIFTGGGSKDTQGIQKGQWLSTSSKPQGKDDISDAYASAYVDPSNGHLILYAGLDRYDNSGDATAGFWFFQNQLGENRNVTTMGGHPFVGTHTNGDILLVSDFTTGGSTSTIKVFKWVGDDATGSLVALNNGNPINGSSFAIVNGAAISVPWSYTNKAGAHQPAAGEFLEEGVDLTALGIGGCFSSFLAETRSSQSPTATLSDFVLGGFPLCSLTATPFNGLSKFDTELHHGDTVTYPLTVTNSGGMPLYIQTVSDTLLGNILVNHTLQAPTSPVTAITSSFDFSQPLATGASLTINVTRPVQSTDADPTADTVTFTGTDDLAGTEDPITASANNSVNLFQPSATLSETASPTSGVGGTPITYTYTIKNTSSSDSPNLVLDPNNASTSFTDTLLGNIESDAIAAAIAAGDGSNGVMSLPAGASFSFTEQRAVQTGDATPLVASSTFAFGVASSGQTSFPNIVHATSSATVHIVNAEISISASGVNEVNGSHTFTVTVKKDLGDGNGFVVAANAPVTVALTDSNGATTTPTTYSLTTNSSGQASVTFTSATAGKVVGNASTTFSVSGVSLTRATGDSNAGDSGPVTKFFEDAKITISPSATNGITEPHTFTVTVLDNAGDGNGYVAAANEPVTVTLTNSNGAVAVPAGPLSGNTDSNGQFQVTFTSNSAGQVTGNASTTFTLNGVSLTRATGDGKGETGNVDGAAAVKTFVAGSLRWKKVDESGALLGGATFLVTATGGTAASTGHTPLSATVVDNTGQAGYTGLDADPAAGKFLLNAFQSFGGSALSGLALGTYSVHETVAPAHYTLDPKTLSATLTAAALTGDLSSTPFVDTLPHLAIVKTVTPGFSSVIEPGDTASYTITVSNTGAGTATNVVVTDSLPGANQLNWIASSSSFTTSIVGGVLTATDASLIGGASASITVSAVVPANFFGNTPNAASTDPVPLGLFELDGNGTTGVLGTSGSTTTSHDWDQVYKDAGSPAAMGSFNTAGPLSAARAGTFATDVTNSTQDDIFTGGGSKDTMGIQKGSWLWTKSKPQGKDDIEHAFAALYTDPTTHDAILYAGLDRFDNSGDATAGFWFLGDRNFGKGTTSSGGGFKFTGTHMDGDILLVSDFTTGGSTSTIKVFRWTGSDATGSLVALNNGNPINGKTFAIVNSSKVTLPWTFTDKSRTGNNQALPGEFLEEGINLTSLGLDACFSNFVAETRSSQSPTATLSDFVIGSFNTCQQSIFNSASVTADQLQTPLKTDDVLISIVDS